VLETTNGNAKDHSSKARVNLWQKYRWGQEEFPVADWPMPENIINFESIQLRFVEFVRKAGAPSSRLNNPKLFKKCK
jgi:hypothetical protein